MVSMGFSKLSETRIWLLRSLNSKIEDCEVPMQDVVDIGREADNDIVFRQDAVSRYHASLHRKGGVLTLIDKGSANGSFVNGKRVTELVLQKGDVLRFDTLEFQIDCDDEFECLELSESCFSENNIVLQNPVKLQSRLLRGRDEPIKAVLFRLDKEKYMVGRSPYNDIIIKADSVSSFHARLEKKEKEWYLIDESSSNGSFINGEHVVDSVLAPGDVISFGKVRMDFDPGEQTLLSYSPKGANRQPAVEAFKNNRLLLGVGVLTTICVVLVGLY